MAISNPTKYVTVRRLDRFRQKLIEEFPSTTVASDALCIAAAQEITLTVPPEAAASE